MKNITVTVSSKGQITLPKALRQRYNIATNSRLTIHGTDTGITITKKPDLEDYFGTGKDIYPGDAVEYVRALRDRE